MKIDKNIFPDRLRQAINSAGLTQVQISSISGVSESSISDYLKGRFTPRAVNVIRLARTLKVNSLWLAGESLPVYNTHTERYTIDFQVFIDLSKNLKTGESIDERYQLKYAELMSLAVQLNMTALERIIQTAIDFSELSKYTLYHNDDIEIDLGVVSELNTI
jgi:transcriptional regulator with XRE-family HTH domain